MGSVATTIGYGHIVPKTDSGKVTCVCFTILAVPLFAILLQYISIYTEELLISMTQKVNTKAGMNILGQNGTKVSQKIFCQ